MTILRTIKRRSPLAGFAIASTVLMWTGLSAQSAEQQIVADASMALGGRERILAVKTLIVEGGGHDLNVGQSLRFDDLGLQSDVWQIREYKRAYDLANTRARFEAIREAQYPYLPGRGWPAPDSGSRWRGRLQRERRGRSDEDLRTSSDRSAGRVLAASAHVGARCTPAHRQIVERTHAGQRAAR